MWHRTIVPLTIIVLIGATMFLVERERTTGALLAFGAELVRSSAIFKHMEEDKAAKQPHTSPMPKGVTLLDEAFDLASALLRANDRAQGYKASCAYPDALRMISEAMRTALDAKRMNATADMPISRRGGAPVALIIGANVGSNYNDDAWGSLVSHYADWVKIFVEPIPPLFEKLKQNTAHLNNTVLVNAAVVPLDKPEGNQEMFCWKMNDDGSTDGGALSKSGISAQHWFNQVCSLERSRLFHKYDLGGLSIADTPQAAQAIEVFTVPAVHPDELLRRYMPEGSRLGVVQVDVEGLDDLIVKGMPWGKPPYYTPLILSYEYVLLAADRFASVDAHMLANNFTNRCTSAQNVVWYHRW